MAVGAATPLTVVELGEATTVPALLVTVSVYVAPPTGTLVFGATLVSVQLGLVKLVQVRPVIVKLGSVLVRTHEELPLVAPLQFTPFTTALNDTGVPVPVLALPPVTNVVAVLLVPKSAANAVVIVGAATMVTLHVAALETEPAVSALLATAAVFFNAKVNVVEVSLVTVLPVMLAGLEEGLTVVVPELAFG